MLRRTSLVLVALILVAGCGKDSSPTAPTNTAPTPPTSAPRITIFGVVKSNGGAAIGGASVRVTGPESTSGTATTDGNGYYSIPNIAVGNVTIEASANGFAGSSATFAVTGDTQRDMTLASTARFALLGVVRDGTSNQPLEGVSVTAVNVLTQTNVRTTTDGGGFYHVAGIAPGQVNVSWTRQGLTTRSEQITFDNADIRRDVTMVAPAPDAEYTITGSARRCGATYTNSSGGTNQEDVTIPWSYRLNPRAGEFLYISCQINTAGDTGNITVTIRRRGSVLQSGSANGFPNIATASGSY